MIFTPLHLTSSTKFRKNSDEIVEQLKKQIPNWPNISQTEMRSFVKNNGELFKGASVDEINRISTGLCELNYLTPSTSNKKRSNTGNKNSENAEEIYRDFSQQCLSKMQRCSDGEILCADASDLRK